VIDEYWLADMFDGMSIDRLSRLEDVISDDLIRRGFLTMEPYSDMLRMTEKAREEVRKRKQQDLTSEGSLS
jgi:hypothetical protein